MSSIYWFTQTSAETDFLLTAGLPTWTITLRHFIRQTLSTLTLLSLFISPIMLAYWWHFKADVILETLISTGLVIIILSFVSQSLGTLLSLSLRYFIHQQGTSFSLSFLTLGIVGIIYVLINLLFPQALRQLYFSDPADFVVIFNQLPLNHPLIPTYYLAQSLIGVINPVSLTFLGVSFLLIVFTLIKVNSMFMYIYQHSQSHVTALTTSNYHTKTHDYRAPLFLHEWFSFVRNSNELGYAAFLLVLSSFFFLLLSQSQSIRQIEPQWHDELSVFVFGWLLFFTTAYTLRLVFPLPLKLVKESWLLLTVGRSKLSLYLNYLLTSLVICLPLLVVGVLTWQLIPLPQTDIFLGTLISLIGIILLIISITYLGLINPDFSQVDSPEAASTSGMGLIALSWALVIIVGFSTIFYLYLQGTVSPLIWLGLLVFILPCLLLISATARYHFSRYEF
jgi:hypothetical protein